VIGKIGQRIAQRGQFPVEHRQNARLGGWKIMLSQRKSPWDVGSSSPEWRGQPCDQRIHVRVAPGQLVFQYCGVQRPICRSK
jgi:hypothetical protein